MKKIEINNQIWYYRVYHIFHEGTYTTEVETRFYLNPIKKVKMFFNLFGPVVEVDNDIPEFVIEGNITDPRNGKEEVKEMILNAMAIHQRKEEIKNGHLI